MTRQYKTARGKKFNMQEFSDAREETTAVGNMNVNARGDILGQGGHIKQKREELVREFYHEAPAQEAEISIKKEIPKEEALVTPSHKDVDEFVTPEEAIQNLMDQQSSSRKSKSKSKIKSGTAKKEESND